MNIKLIFISLFFLFLYPLQVSAQLSGDSWQHIQKEKHGTLTIFYFETPAFMYKNKQGEMKGVCAEILTDFQAYVKDKYGVAIQYDFKASERQFSSFLHQVKEANDGVLGVGNVSITEERKKEMKFSNPYFRNLTVLLTHKNTPRINKMSELSKQLEGYTAIIVKGSTYEDIFQDMKEKHMPATEVRYVADGPEMLDILTSEPKTFSLSDFVDYYLAIKTHRPVRTHLTSTVLPHEDLGFVMPMGSDWQGVFNEFLNEDYVNSIAYKKVINENVGASFLKFLDKI